jgi:hypothetical protein
MLAVVAVQALGRQLLGVERLHDVDGAREPALSYWGLTSVLAIGAAPHSASGSTTTVDDHA